MAKRENHEKRTDLYAKAQMRIPELSIKEQLIRDLNDGKGPGTFIVPPRVKASGEGFNILREDSGIKWLPPEGDK
jgi:hypothetical protein